MYRTAVWLSLLFVLAVIAVDGVVRLLHRGDGGKAKAMPRSPMGYLRILVNAAGFLALAAAAYTGFSALMTANGAMTGDALIQHVTFAPVFALASVAVTIFWAERNRFAAHDRWPVILRKLFFWCAVVLAVPTILSILAAMFPLFGSEDQENLFLIHRYCALLLSASGLLFAYFAVVTRRERSEE